MTSDVIYKMQNDIHELQVPENRQAWLLAEIAYQLAVLNESLHPLLREGSISSTIFEKEK